LDLTYYELIVVARAGSPAILVAIWAIENSRTLEREGKQKKNRSQSEGMRSDGKWISTNTRGSCRTRSAIGIVVYTKLEALSPRNKGSDDKLTFPIVARPKPPFGAHSSLATRSSLVGRIARHSEVTCCPWLLTSV
jgi:hypothetical protein